MVNAEYSWLLIERIDRDYHVVICNKLGLHKTCGKYRNIYAALDRLQREVKFKLRMNQIFVNLMQDVKNNPALLNRLKGQYPYGTAYLYYSHL